MMKFFRKYNKHLLAIFMALLVIVWVGGSALTDMLAPKPGNDTIGTSKYGVITAADTQRAEQQARLLDSLSLRTTPEGQVPRSFSWTSLFGGAGGASGERLTNVDWILLQEEAREFGIEVTPAKAKRVLLTALRASERDLQIVAARSNVTVESYYEAFADVLAILEMQDLFRSAATPSEPTLRMAAKSFLERAEVEIVKFPAASFVDVNQTFTEEELSAHFEEYRDKHATPGSVRFGYYIEPTVDLQYIRIDPVKIRESMSGNEKSDEKLAFRYWEQNQSTDQRFRLPTEALIAAFKKQQEATSNGVAPPSAVKPYYDNFADARTIALEAVKNQKAEREANTIATELARKLADPWYDVKAGKGEYKTAPDEVKSMTYFDGVIASVPSAKRNSNAIEVAFVEKVTRYGLSKMIGVGTAQLPLINDRSLPLYMLAFNVEGLEEIPKDDAIDRSLFLSQWQTQVKPLYGEDGAIYMFRVTKVTEGHEPSGLAEVRDRVEADLRLLAGMERAKAAAKSLAAKDTGGPLQDLWGGETELRDKITPDKGGYFEPPSFPRGRKIADGQTLDVDGVGNVSQAFIDESFRLAADDADSSVAVVELPDQAAWVAIKGKSFTPLYEDTFEAQKHEIRRQMGTLTVQRLILVDWLNNKKVRERTEFKFDSGA